MFLITIIFSKLFLMRTIIYFTINSQPIQTTNDICQDIDLLNKYSKLYKNRKDTALTIIKNAQPICYKKLLEILRTGQVEFTCKYKFKPIILIFSVLRLADQLSISEMDYKQETEMFNKNLNYYNCFKLFEIRYGINILDNYPKLPDIKKIAKILKNNKMTNIKKYFENPSVKDFVFITTRAPKEYAEYFLEKAYLTSDEFGQNQMINDKLSWLRFINYHEENINITNKDYFHAYDFVNRQVIWYKSCSLGYFVWSLMIQAPETKKYFKIEIFKSITEYIKTFEYYCPKLTNKIWFKFLKQRFNDFYLFDKIFDNYKDLFVAIMLSNVEGEITLCDIEKMYCSTKNQIRPTTRYDYWIYNSEVDSDNYDDVFNKIFLKHKILYKHYKFNTDNFLFENEQDKMKFLKNLDIGSGYLTKSAIK